MNHHYKKLGFKIPDNYFKEFKKKTLVLITKNNLQVNKSYSFSFYQLSIAAIIICTLVYYTFSSSNEIETNFNSDSPIISTILSDEEITEEFMIEYFAEEIVFDQIYIPK